MRVQPDRVEASEKVVTALVAALYRVLIAVALESAVGKAFVVIAPTDAFIFKKIDNGGDILVNEDETVAVQAEGITPVSYTHLTLPTKRIV